jgi:hypothetical protein
MGCDLCANAWSATTISVTYLMCMSILRPFAIRKSRGDDVTFNANPRSFWKVTSVFKCGKAAN